MDNIKEEKFNINAENISLKEFRQRCFVRRSQALFGSKYTFVDDLPEQVESLSGFTNWESFSITWDVYWVGLDPRTLAWVAGRHNSPVRKLVLPLRIVEKDERTNRILETHLDKADIKAMEMPYKEPIPETEQDRVISDSLTGKVVIDEPDADKAIRLIEHNMKLLQEQLSVLTRK